MTISGNRLNGGWQIRFLTLIFVFCGCSTYKPAMDGTYAGYLPCKGGKVVQTMIRLNNDRTFEMENLLDGSSGDLIRSSGTYKTVRSGHQIVLGISEKDGLKTVVPYVFEITDEGLKTGKDQAFLLLKQKDEVLETYWKLVKLHGKNLTGPSEIDREAHLVLKILENRVFGSGGCNRFSGTYTLSGHKITFSELISTKMACMDINYEQNYLKALGDVNQYRLQNGTLLLLKDDEVMAEFILKHP